MHCYRLTAFRVRYSGEFGAWFSRITKSTTKPRVVGEVSLMFMRHNNYGMLTSERTSTR